MVNERKIWEVAEEQVEHKENPEPQTVVDMAVQHVRKLIEAFQREVDPANPYAGKLVDNVPGAESAEVPLLEARLYVVDDEILNQTAVRRILSRKKFSRIQTFANGREVLEAMYKDGELAEVPHLIFSDTNMPGMGGTELAEKIQQIDPAVRPRFIAMTGNVHAENIKKYVELGIPVLEKPFNFTDVLALVVQELRNHQGFKAESSTVEKE